MKDMNDWNLLLGTNMKRQQISDCAFVIRTMQKEGVEVNFQSIFDWMQGNDRYNTSRFSAMCIHLLKNMDLYFYEANT
jgi:D-mannonate dehydratase